MSKSAMKAKKLVLTVLDTSMILSIWSGGKLDRSGVRSAVEISDSFEPVLEEHAELLGKAAQRGEDAEEAVEGLIEATEEFTLSVGAFDSIRNAIKEHDKWTNRGARQLLRIEEAFSAAEDVDLEPKKVEE